MRHADIEYLILYLTELSWNIPKNLYVLGSNIGRGCGATKTRSVAVDKSLMRTVRHAPGLSLYEISKILHWSNGKVDGSLRRLINSRKVLVSAVERDGRRVNLVYPRPTRPHDVVEIPISLLKLGNPLWKDDAFIYALDSTTVGITGTCNPEWEKLACFAKKVKLTPEKERFLIKLPRQFMDFYHLESKHVTRTVNSNNVLLTIDGQLITSKPYPAR